MLSKVEAVCNLSTVLYVWAGPMMKFKFYPSEILNHRFKLSYYILYTGQKKLL
jgi:hypothetical protein